MYHGSRTIEMTYDYKVRLTVGGEHLDNSKGLDTVQNFAFIASLLKVAKNRANLELSAEAYPLAMDAVFHCQLAVGASKEISTHSPPFSE